MIADTENRVAPSLWLVAFILCILGAGVLYTWHYPDIFAAIHNNISAMAYNTSLCMIAAGIALTALFKNTRLVLTGCAAFIFIISVSTLLEKATGLDFHVDSWFSHFFSGVKAESTPMSPTTATSLLLMGSSLLLLACLEQSKSQILIVPAALLSLISITISFIALLSHAVGLVQPFSWLSIKMAPHTAAGLSLFSVAVLSHIYPIANRVFSRYNFFSRIVIGFGFMGILVMASCSIAFMQINAVSGITHRLYENPLQVNNTSLRIKTAINDINRELKNIAISKESTNCNGIPEQLSPTETKIARDLDFIQATQPLFANQVSNLHYHIDNWINFSRTSCEILASGNFDDYAERTVYEGQKYVLLMDSLLDHISNQAQLQIGELNRSAETSEIEAKKIILVIALAFLIIGIAVASVITRSLNDQLQTIRHIMLDIAQDPKNQPIPFLEHPEEVGDMARALKVFSENLLARKELETGLLQVIEAMPNGVILVNSEGVIEILNSQAEKIFGYERSELLGKTVEHLLPTKVAGHHPTFRESFFKNPTPRAMGTGRELFGLRSDGKEFPLEIGLAPVNTKDGMKVLASIVDITERRNAAMELSRSTERLELTTRINQIGVWEYIVNDGTLIWNDAMFEIYGRSREFFTSDYAAWKQCVHPADLEPTEKLLQQAIKSMAPFAAKFRIILPDGSVRYIHAKAKIDRNVQTQQLRILGTNIDVTREELALSKIHNLEVLRSAIVEYSEDAIISKTPLGIITSWNIGARNMFGYTAEEAIGVAIKDLLFPPELAFQEEILLAQVRSGIVIKHFETLRRCKDGRLINVSITLSPIKDAMGKIVGISAIKRDITESIKINKMLEVRQRELEYSNKELERSNKELEAFAYVASHDLKSPLRGIAQLSTWIEEDISTQEFDELKSHTDALRNRIQRMEKLLDDLLIFYRAGKAEGAITNLDINQMVIDIFDIQNNKPGLRLEILNSLPTLATLSTPLEQIIRNLISNAIKHHDKQEGLIQISSREVNDEFIEFSVCDDGPGIPPKFHERIFGMFQTLKPRDEIEGSGMGLALIKKLVENYGGSIRVKSEGRGSCFIFTWPIHIQRREEND